MAKGDFKSEFGGPKSEYVKGRKDAQSSFLNRIVKAIEKIVKGLTK